MTFIPRENEPHEDAVVIAAIVVAIFIFILVVVGLYFGLIFLRTLLH